MQKEKRTLIKAVQKHRSCKKNPALFGCDSTQTMVAKVASFILWTTLHVLQFYTSYKEQAMSALFVATV